MKRVLILGLVIVAAAALFAACGDGGDDETAERTGIVRIIGDSN